jgi:peroxiredoxin-like protein
MDKVHEYQTSVEWGGKRQGKVESPGLSTLTSGSPPEFGGEPGMWTPEHLFVAAANTCLMTTFLAIADLSKMEVAGWASSAKGKLEKLDGQGWIFTDIAIEARVKIARAADVDRARRLVEKAEQNCLISKSMKAPVHVRATITAEA